MLNEDLGILDYRSAWKRQQDAHAAVLAGGEEQLFLVEHPPVITLGRRPGVARNLVASAESLAQLGVELVQSDRGGDITFHGPGQLVAYPIIRLADHRLSVGGYMRLLQEVVIATLADFDIPAELDTSAVGVWTRHDNQVKKLCSFGVRVKRGVTLHGLALNVTTDLRYFDLIVPCGLPGRAVTSIQQLLGEGAPTMQLVKYTLTHRLQLTLDTVTLRTTDMRKAP